MRFIYIVILAVFCFGTIAYPGALHARQKTPDLNERDITSTPALIKADTLTYDSKDAVINAVGNVEIIQGARILVADAVTYDKNKNIVIAKGHISLLEPNGTVVFAEEVELHDSLKKGVVENFSARFTDNSRIAARVGEKINENTVVMKKVVYSPCPICKEKPERSPLWQVAAQKATIDNEKQKVVYNNAFFEIYGIPTLYTPYFSHPTPDADRKSGFLTPKYTHDRIFGTTLKTPYYYNISENRDAVITPILTSNEGGILSGEYRHLLYNGSYQLKGSITNPERVDSTGNKVDGNDLRSHIEGYGDFSINKAWGWGFNAKRASDDTYLQKYHFGDEDVLTSNLYASRIENRDHVLLNTISFQGLKTTDIPGQTPLILPYAESHTERKVSDIGTKASLDTNVLALTRSEGVSSKRVSIKGGIQQPMITKSGQVMEASLSLRGDGYSVDNVPTTSTTKTIDGMEGRVVPEAAMKWSLPLMKNTHTRQYMLEPITKFIVSPNGGNPDAIPNEDSQDIEFSAENLFDSNHFSGYDKIDNGARMNYGIRGGASDAQHGDVSFLFGQSYRAKQDRNFSVQSGLADNFSDYVGRLGYSKNDIFDIAYKFRFDKDSLTVRNNTIAGTVDYAPVHLTIDYVAINDNSAATAPVNTGGDTREIMIAGTKIDLTEKWQFVGGGNRNLAVGEWVSTKSGFVYKGNCVDFSLDWNKEFTRDRDIQPSTTISFQVSLKNMGQTR